MNRELGDIPIGNLGESRTPVLQTLRDLGIIVSPGLIPQWRAHLHKGSRTADLIGCSRIGNAGLKNSLYLNILETAQRVRTLTGISYYKKILPIHRDALVYGRLGHPYRSHRS